MTQSTRRAERPVAKRCRPLRIWPARGSGQMRSLSCGFDRVPYACNVSTTNVRLQGTARRSPWQRSRSARLPHLSRNLELPGHTIAHFFLVETGCRKLVNEKWSEHISVVVVSKARQNGLVMNRIGGLFRKRERQGIVLQSRDSPQLTARRKRSVHQCRQQARSRRALLTAN